MQCGKASCEQQAQNRQGQPVRSLSIFSASINRSETARAVGSPHFENGEAVKDQVVGERRRDIVTATGPEARH